MEKARMVKHSFVQVDGEWRVQFVVNGRESIMLSPPIWDCYADNSIHAARQQARVWLKSLRSGWKYAREKRRDVMEKAYKEKEGTTIGTAAGTAYYVRTEIENSNGKWNDSYTVRDGYWVIHNGREHDVYKVRD